VCSLVGGTVTMNSGTGTCTIDANQSGNTNYSAAPQVQTSATATLASPTITFSAAPPATYPGPNFTVSATTNSNGALTYSYVSGPCTQVSGGTFSPTGVGTCVVQAKTAATTNFAAGSASQSVTIASRTGAALAPTTLSFAAQDGGTTSAAKTLTLTNYLTSSLSISASLGGANPGDFTVQASSTCPYPTGSLPANSSCTYNITFTPSQNGAESATLSVVDADGTLTARLYGTGIGATLAPSVLTFVPQDGGTTSAAKTLTLNNYLSASLAISASFGGANPGDFAVSGGTCPYPTGSLSGNSSCTYNITFTPSVNGPDSATLSVSDADGTQTAKLSGTGIGATLSPTTVSFGTLAVGTTSAAKTLTLTNYLASALSISASLGGANPGDFTVQASSTCPYPTGSLPANSSCTYKITFTPSAPPTAESATLSVSDADGTQATALKGTGK